MKEIEILVEVYDSISDVKKSFKKFNYVGLKHTIDEYYYDPKRELLKPDKNNQLNHCLRLRSKNNTYSITYKDDVFENGKWLYSNEYETQVDDIKVMKSIFKRLGFKKLLKIDNKKETYQFKDYEIVLEQVKDLGIFMEVEFCTQKDVDVVAIKKEIQAFIDGLGINVSKELNMGKPEMFIRKNNIKIKN